VLPSDPEIRTVSRRPARAAEGQDDVASVPADEVVEDGRGAIDPAGEHLGASGDPGEKGRMGDAIVAMGDTDPAALEVDGAPGCHRFPLGGAERREDLAVLRARAWSLAARLAERNGIGELVAPLEENGLGFVVRDVPDASLAGQLDEDSVAKLSMLWWTLAACAEITVAPLEAILAVVAEGSVLERALASQDAGLLFESVWTLDPGHVGYRLWRTFDDRDWQDLLALMETYRAMHRAAGESGIDLWSVQQ
jgi:hypothetical protein